MGPTRPPDTRQHPWIEASVGDSEYSTFCQYGCASYYLNRTLKGCRRDCEKTYYYETEISGGTAEWQATAG